MTITQDRPSVDGGAPQPTSGPKVEVLFREAHQRRRRRRLLAATLSLLLLASVLAIGIGTSGGTPHRSPPTTTHALSTAAVITATRKAATAQVSLTLRLTSPGGPTCTADASGRLDFRRRRLALATTRAPRCGYSPFTIRAFQSVVYSRGPTVWCRASSCGPASITRPWLSEPIGEFVGPIRATGLMRTPYLLTLLRALPARLHPLGGHDSQGLTEYVTATSLSQIDALASEASGPERDALMGLPGIGTGLDGLAPSAIRIRATLWVDPHHRLVRLSVTQPLKVAAPRGSETSSGYVVTSSSTNTMVLSHFGVPARIQQPPGASVNAA